jgi:hypothetical protein
MTERKTSIVERIRSRVHDAPMPTEWLLDDAADEIERLRRALEQIAIVCTDNMDRDCNHRMALDFVRHIANDATEIQT